MPLQAPGIVAPELLTPWANGLTGHCDPPLGEQILDISEADTASVLEADCMTDDFAGIPVSVITDRVDFMPQVCPQWSKLTVH